MDNLLFFQDGDLSEYLRKKEKILPAHVDDLNAEQVNGASDDELVAHVVEEFHIEPLVLHEDRAIPEHAEAMVDVSQDRNRAVFDPNRPLMINANRITLTIPFTGEPDLLDLRPSTSSLSHPRGRVNRNGDMGGEIIISHVLPKDQDASEFKRWMESEVTGVRNLTDYSRSDVKAFNARLEQQARSAVAARRQQLERLNELLVKLNIPLKRTTTVSTPLPLPKRRLKPLPPPRAVDQEYQIRVDDYEFILNILRHQTRSFEQTPSGFRKLNEEENRDVMLATLNTHFHGDAAGERFRRRGKTDICIEHANRAAFVAECKLWTGQKAASEAIDQLLKYLTWRDCRAALVFFNMTVKGFKSLQDGMSNILKNHRRFVRILTSGHEGEWRAEFRAIDDDARLIVVHVFVVNLFTSEA